MHILKLSWLGHKGEHKQVECYSITISADGKRIASGGLDGNVKIWDTDTVTSFKGLSDYDNQTENPDLPDASLRRALCSMSRHNGVVTSVKFSPEGRFLASGSDDKIVLVWEKDEELANRPKQFGEAEADLEHWTVRKRLVAHDNDIQDICWSPDGALLVTVGLDRSIIIWNGVTFERIKRYDLHQSMVKGVVFDPANKFFATASDDRTVRIFRYHKKINEYNNYEFQTEHIVFEPFKKSPLTSYFRRMSWSPDGQHIAVPNATNGPVSSVAIINRGSWATDVSLIGHEAPCEVCSFSPRLFRLADQSEKERDNFTTILATAGQDRTLGIWSTANSRPLVVASDIVKSSITDICWSPDGEKLFLSSLDGSITCVIFEKNELGEIVSEDWNDIQLHRYGADRESVVFPESVQQLRLEEKAKNSVLNEINLDDLRPKSKEETTEVKKVEVKEKTPSEMPSNGVTKLNQNVTISKNGKKRVAPTLISSSSSAAKPIATSTRITKPRNSSKISQSSYYLPRLGIQTAVMGSKSRQIGNVLQREENNDIQDNDNDDMGIDEANNNVYQQNLSEATLKRQRNRVKRSIMEMRYPTNLKLVSNLPVSLFNNQSLVNHDLNELLRGSKEGSQETFNSTFLDVDEDLVFSVIMCGVEHKVDDGESKEKRDIVSTLEVRNGKQWDNDAEDVTYDNRTDFQDPTVVIISSSLDRKDRKNILYFPHRIQHATPIVIDHELVFYVLISFNGTVQIILADSGNLLCPSFELGNNAVSVKHLNSYLMIVTSAGLIYTWKLAKSQKQLKSIVRCVSLSPIINNTPLSTSSINQVKKSTQVKTQGVRSIDINPMDGSPLVVLENCNDVYGYSLSLQSWVSMMDSWYFLAVDEAPSSSNTLLADIFRKTFESMKNDIKRKTVNNYIFDDNSQELKIIMMHRLSELSNLEL